MSFGQYIGSWFDWTIWSLFSSAIDMLDMYIGLLSGLAVAFLINFFHISIYIL